MTRAIITAALSALWLIACCNVPTSMVDLTTPALSGTAQAGTTVKSSKSNTSDRKGGNKTGTPPSGSPGGRGY